MIDFTFQINFIGTLSAETPEEARELITKQVEELTVDDYKEATDFYYLAEDNTYKREWIIPEEKNEQESK
tara:strand:+ start:1504 stop:1713 length:210 start_codon:yes stop_codon:yes gene_type:complete